MLVLAGPGSGKTTVIAERVRYLIEERGVEPGRILTITFTKAAAYEMQRRCQQICKRAEAAVFGTFHSVFYHFLRKSEKYQNFTLINEKEKKEMMKKIIPCGKLTDLQHEYVCESALKKISFYKNSARILQEEDQAFQEVMGRYCRLCKEQEKLDFDDMLVLCYELFAENPGEAVKWQNRFEYILVDEFQDINRCQYDVVKQLAQIHGNLFVVGDDDQAIYSFRGSDPGFMKQFLADFQGCRQVCLAENYRSGQEIVEIAQKSISHNLNRFPKKMCAVSASEYQVTVKRYDSFMEEITAIAEKIRRMTQTEREKRKGSAAILVRTNAEAEYVAEQFYKLKIPCSVKEKRSCFYENRWVQDILSVLRFAVDGQKRSDFLVFMNKPFRGMERSMLQEERVNLYRLAEEEKRRGNETLSKELEAMGRCIKLIREMDAYGAVKLVLSGMKYMTYAETTAGNDIEMRGQIKEVTDELTDRARAFGSIRELLTFAQTYIGAFRENEAGENRRNEVVEGDVQIMTYHASKGLEFDTVFLPMLCTGRVPHGHMLTKEQTEEERRMFYVAMTRAKHQLILSWHGTSHGTEASMFLKELRVNEIGT